MWVLLGFIMIVARASGDPALEEQDLVGSMGSGQISLEVEHSFDNGRSFVPRGTLTIHSLRSNSASFDSVVTLSETHIKALEQLCQTDGLYLMRLIGGDGTVHRTGMDACRLLESSFNDVITVHLDWRMRVVAVSVVAYQATSSSTSSGFKTKVLVQHMEAGPQPDTASFIQKLEQDKLAHQRGETKDNRSFLAKYWMYIIPVVLVFAMGSGGGQDGGR